MEKGVIIMFNKKIMFVKIKKSNALICLAANIRNWLY